MAVRERKALGIGLDVLFGNDPAETGESLMLPLSKIEPRAEQPREAFDEEALQAELDSLPSVAKLDIDTVAKDAGNPRGANMVLLGMAAPYIEILTVEQLRAAISVVFECW